MENGYSPGDMTPPTATGRLTEAERRALRERTAQARAAASVALESYAMLLAQSRHCLTFSEERLVAIEATREMLRESVRRYALLMKALDTPPERMLRLVKEALAEQLPHPEREEETLALFRNAVTWCIEAYYDNPPAA